MSAHPALATMLRGQQAAVAARRHIETSVEYQSDASRPGRTAVTIIGPSRAAVQAEITRCMTAAENMGNSFCQFLHPMIARDGTGIWSSRGEVVVEVIDDQVAG